MPVWVGVGVEIALVLVGVEVVVGVPVGSFVLVRGDTVVPFTRPTQ